MGDCPTNGLRMLGVWFHSVSPAVDSTSGNYRVADNLVEGSVCVRQCCTLAGATVLVSDAYDVTGVTPGTTVALEALLTVDGAVWTSGCGGSGCSGVYEAYLSHGVDRDSLLNIDHLFLRRTEHHDVLRIPFAIVAGRPERLEIRLHARRIAGGGHASEAPGMLSFRGLSPGMAIVSCQGFAGQVVRVRPVSWGRLKTIYR